jgi:hypothetical protein
MALQHTAWEATRTRRLDLFVVCGTVTPSEPRLGDGGTMVTTRVSLEKPDHQPLLPDVLILRLDVHQERRFPYTPPDPLPAHQARYERTSIGPDEDTCTTVSIRHHGTPLIDIPVRGDEVSVP